MLQPATADLFARVGATIHDAASKILCPDEELSRFIWQISGGKEGCDYNITAHFDHENNAIYIPAECPGYDRVALHELIHWTGHISRLGRYRRFHEELCCPSHAYNLEEMVAEIGSLMLCEKLGIGAGRSPIKWLALWRMSFLGSSTHTKQEATVIAKRDAAEAVAYIFERASTERKAA